MSNNTEDENKIGDDQETAEAEHEEAHDKEPSNKDLIKTYEADKKEDKEEDKKKWAKAKDKVIEEPNKYASKVQR